jgi:pimeloyl-ACP methyl ester carboxylesterase
VAWQLRTIHPERVTTLAALSAPHPRVPQTLRQAEMDWYQRLFQFEATAEATLQSDNWAWLRWFTRNHGDLEPAITGAPTFEALEMGIWTRQREHRDLPDEVHYSDRGVRYLAIRYTGRLDEVGAAAPAGSRGDRPARAASATRT